MLILGLKMTHSPHFRQNMNFLRKKALLLFSVYWILTLCKKQRKAMSQSWEKDVTDKWLDRQSWIHRNLWYTVCEGALIVEQNYQSGIRSYRGFWNTHWKDKKHFSAHPGANIFSPASTETEVLFFLPYKKTDFKTN